jgi:Tfp pilus assembly protein PilN
MIRINLALRKQPSGAVDATKGTGATFNTFSLDRFRDARLDGLKDIPIKKLAVLVVVIGVSWYVVDDWKSSRLAELDARVASISEERDRLAKGLAKAQELEVLKKALESDEAIIRNKIGTVQKLIQDRQTPPKVLLALSTSLPNGVWIKDFRIADDGVTFHGSSLNITQISDFMKAIGDNALFQDVRLVRTEQAKDSRSGLDIAEFELQAKRRTQ